MTDLASDPIYSIEGLPSNEGGPTHGSAARALKGDVKRLLGLSGTRQVDIIAGPARGVSMILDFSGHTPMYLGMYEWELHAWLREHLPATSIVFDVGGYIGYYALMFASKTTGNVVTFEPDPVRADELRSNIALNPRLERRITVSPMAISSESSEITSTLDSMAATIGPPDLVKIDIDGGELDVLRGGLTTLRENHPHVVVETHSLELENACGSLLSECGYRPVVKRNRKIWRETRGGLVHNRWLLASGALARG